MYVSFWLLDDLVTHLVSTLAGDEVTNVVDALAGRLADTSVGQLVGNLVCNFVNVKDREPLSNRCAVVCHLPKLLNSELLILDSFFV